MNYILHSGEIMNHPLIYNPRDFKRDLVGDILKLIPGERNKK